MIYKEYKGRLIKIVKQDDTTGELKDLIRVTTSKKRPNTSDKYKNDSQQIRKVNLITIKNSAKKKEKPPLPNLIIRGEAKRDKPKIKPEDQIVSVESDKTTLSQSMGNVSYFLTEEKTISVKAETKGTVKNKEHLPVYDFDSKFRLIMNEKTKLNTPISKFHRYQNSLVFTKMGNSELDEVVHIATSKEENLKLAKSPSLPNFSNEIIVDHLKLNKINSPPIEYPNSHERTRMIRFLKHFGSISIFKANSKKKSYKL